METKNALTRPRICPTPLQVVPGIALNPDGSLMLPHQGGLTQ